MEKTLRDVITNAGSNPPPLNAFLTVYGVGLSYRFPFVTELETIGANEVESVADFSVACTLIGIERWNSLQGGTTGQQPGSFVRQARAS